MTSCAADGLEGAPEIFAPSRPSSRFTELLPRVPAAHWRHVVAEYAEESATVRELERQARLRRWQAVSSRP